MATKLTASDRREMVDLLIEFEGLSRVAAKRLVGDALPFDLVQSLAKLRQVKSDRQAHLKSSSVASRPEPIKAPAKQSSAEQKPKKVPYTLLLPPEQLDALRAISERDDSSVSHLIRQAIRTFLRTYKL